MTLTTGTRGGDWWARWTREDGCYDEAGGDTEQEAIEEATWLRDLPRDIHRENWPINKRAKEKRK